MIIAPTPDAVARAAEGIRAGEVVAFPTETVYGLGADATNPTAVARVFEIKARPSFDPLIVHVTGLEMLHEIVASVPAPARTLAEHYWPGPLTVVLPKTSRVPDIATAGLPSVAVRVPDHPVARDLIARCARPIAAPSANPFGYISPTTAAHVAEQLGAKVSMILDGGPCTVGVESTIVSFLNDTPRLLRPGGVPLEDIRHMIGPVRSGGVEAEILAPGLHASHYAPGVQLVLIDAPGDVPGADRAGAAVLLPQADAGVAGFAHVECLSHDGALPTVAANLFAALRRLDQRGDRRIYAVRVPEHGLGRAIMDRLRRAAATASHQGPGNAR